MNQLILHKHILDDHAFRHEEVLRYLQSRHLAQWASQLNAEQTVIADQAKNVVLADYTYLLSRYKQYSEHHQTAINNLTSSTALAESWKQISLATQVTKLTILASVFLPLSFCTGIFGMNFVELDGLSIWIWAVVTIAIGIVTLIVYGWDEKHRWISRFSKIAGRKRSVKDDMLDA
jgi:Mg2+ and Co2+ transporter CorA